MPARAARDRLRRRAPARCSWPRARQVEPAPRLVPWASGSPPRRRAGSTPSTTTCTWGRSRATLEPGRRAHLRAVGGGGARARRRAGLGAAARARGGGPARPGARPSPPPREAPAWIEQLVLAADQFVVQPPARRRSRRPVGDRRLSLVRRLGPRHHDRAARPHARHRPARGRAAHPHDLRALRGPRHAAEPSSRTAGEAPEYNTVDATLWYVEAVRAYHAATGDDGALRELFPALEQIVRRHAAGTRYGIGVDPATGSLRAGEPGVQLTWMDAKVGDWVVTPRIGKPVEINALWYNALRAMAGLRAAAGPPARAVGGDGRARARPASPASGTRRPATATTSSTGPTAHDAALRPNQILAVSLPASPLSPERQRRVVDACARHLLTSYGLRSLAPGEPGYQRALRGRPARARRRLSPGHRVGLAARAVRARAPPRPRRPRGRARLPRADGPAPRRLRPRQHRRDLRGEPPFRPDGCIAQAWSVAETLRAWCELAPRA